MKKTTTVLIKNKLQMYRWCNYILLFTPAFSSQWTKSNACKLKIALGVGFSVTENVNSQERGKECGKEDA